ncbi:unnamed protein product [Clavelina lepadiformis]|uniref:HTH CENPB-type domain-containing protein n=1 Tax=Clavelina lepadiformis TaxID=159417 RepID=A0ABP0G7S8_CLALP
MSRAEKSWCNKFAEIRLNKQRKAFKRITELSDPAPPSKQSSAQKDKTKTKQFQASVGRFSELEDMLYVWIDSKHCTSLPVQPSLLVLKAKQIAEQLLISEDDLKASWQWLSRFRSRRGLQKLLLHDEKMNEQKWIKKTLDYWLH